MVAIHSDVRTFNILDSAIYLELCNKREHDGKHVFSPDYSVDRKWAQRRDLLARVHGRRWKKRGCIGERTINFRSNRIFFLAYGFRNTPLPLGCGLDLGLAWCSRYDVVQRDHLALGYATFWEADTSNDLPLLREFLQYTSLDVSNRSPDLLLRKSI